MYQPRRANEAPATGLPIDLDGASLAAFRSAPRRAATSRAAAVTARVAPASLSVALVATVGAILVNPRPSEADQLTAVPDRSEQVSRGDAQRDELPQRAIAEGLVTDAEKAPAPAEQAAPVAAAWATQFGAVTGKKYAQVAATVRAQASAESAEVGKLAAGDSVDATDIVTNGMRQVVLDKKVGWVADDALGNAAPKPKAEPKPAATQQPTAKAAAAPAYSGPSVLGLKPRAMVVYNAVMANFSVPSVGGYRSSSLSSHQCGLAIDFMVYTDRALGDAIADYVIGNAGAWGITHVIWRQRIWTPYQPYWRPMADRGGITANHYDHVHVALADHC